MKLERIELFATNDIKDKLENLKPWDDCKKCTNGFDIIKNEFCECTLEAVLKLILDIPKRYDTPIELVPTLKKQLIAKAPFYVLSGENKYINLVAYHIAKELIKTEKLIVKYVDSKQFITPEYIAALSEADIILFEDFYKARADIAYKSYLSKRVGKQRAIIFIGKTELINFDDDFIEVDIDSSDVKVK